MIRAAAACQLASWFVARLLRAAYAVRVHRPQDLLRTPAGTRLILMPTHQSVLDPWLLMNAFDLHEWRSLVPVRALATQDFHGGFLSRIRPLLRILYRLNGVVVLPPRRAGPLPLRRKVAGLLAALDRGETVAIFPEGRVRSKEGPPIRPFAPGVVYVHRASRAPVVPIAVWLGRPRPPRRHLIIRIGKPVQVPARLGLRAGAEWLRQRTLELYRCAEEMGRDR